MTKLSSEHVTSTTTLLNNGKSSREVAKIVGCGKSTVANYRNVTATEAPDPKVGRSQKLTSRDKRAIARSIVNGGVKTAVEMARLINTEREDKISPVTIRRALKEEWLKAFKKKKKPFLSKAHRRARLKWALNHQNWAIEDWKRVIFSDETKLNRVGSDGIKYFWGRSFSDLGPAAVEETLKFGGGVTGYALVIINRGVKDDRASAHRY
ncbi:hypothetical protein K3495_g12713 [Podosphaera aphanis]|nr:hypothetical protein K3495_g12713 [Podosphaera aphanis]